MLGSDQSCGSLLMACRMNAERNVEGSSTTSLLSDPNAKPEVSEAFSATILAIAVSPRLTAECSTASANCTLASVE